MSFFSIMSNWDSLQSKLLISSFLLLILCFTIIYIWDNIKIKSNSVDAFFLLLAPGSYLAALSCIGFLIYKSFWPSANQAQVFIKIGLLEGAGIVLLIFVLTALITLSVMYLTIHSLEGIGNSLNHVGKKKSPSKKSISTIKILIRDNRTQDALNLLEKVISEIGDHELEKQITMLLSRLKRCNDDNIKGVIDNNEREITINKIKENALNLCDSLDIIVKRRY